MTLKHVKEQEPITCYFEKCINAKHCILLDNKKGDRMKNYIHEVYIHAVISAEKLNELINSELDKKGKPKQKQSGSGAKNTTQPSPTQVFFVKIKCCVTII